MYERKQVSMFYYKGIFNFLIYMKLYMYNILMYIIKQIFYYFIENIKIIKFV